MKTNWTATAALLWTMMGMALTGAAQAHDELDPDAVDRLRSSMNYLAGMEVFGLEAHSSVEVVLLSGQKIEFDSSNRLTVQRPDKLHATRLGDVARQEFFYDGESLTLHDVDGSVYATVPAPGTLEEMLEFAREYLDIVAPAGDLIYSNAFDIIMEGVHRGFIVGSASIDGTACDHLAFSAPGTDFQIWIQQGDRPLPRKMVITSRDVVNAPQFTIVLNSWDLNPDLSADLFHFEPPEDAVVIDFITLTSSDS